MPEYSTSSLQDAAVCLKRYEYRNVLKLVPRPDRVRPPLRRGIWIHACLEALARGRDWQRTLLDMESWALDHGVPEDQTAPMAAEVRDIMDGYQDFWAENEDDPWEPVAAEVPLRFTIPGTDVTIRATIDTLVRDRRGLWIVEHKSTQHFPDATWRCIDPQTALQYALCRTLPAYRDLKGIIFNYLSTQVPAVPQVKRNGEFYARDYATTTRAFERALPDVYSRYAGSREETEAYIRTARANMVVDQKFYARYRVYRPEEAIFETLNDEAAIIDQVREAERKGYFRRTIHLLICPLCPYSALCPVEYVQGKPSPGLRADLFAVETPDLRSEGRPVYAGAV